MHTPDQFRRDYSIFYRDNLRDSPDRSTHQIAELLTRTILLKLASKDHISVINIGAGRQFLEKSIQPFITQQQNRVSFITGDIADLSNTQLLASNNAQHLQLDGARLPFSDSSADIAVSSMAIDFMPRVAFWEVNRILKPNGIFIATLHHQDLIDIAKLQMPDLARSILSLQKKLEYCQNPKKRDKYIIKLKQAEQIRENLHFLMNIFPEHIFFSTQEIMSFLHKVFGSEAHRPKGRSFTSELCLVC